MHPDDPHNSPSEERRLLQLMMQELRTRSHELVKRIEQLTRSLSPHADSENAAPSVEGDEEKDST